jgi:hypothetical protein
MKATLLILASVYVCGSALAQGGDVQTVPTGGISGRVINSSDGDPISNASLMITPGGTDGSRTVSRSFENGRFIFPVRIGREYVVMIESPGFASRSIKVMTHQGISELPDIRLQHSDADRSSKIAGISPDLLKQIRDDLGVADSDGCFQEDGITLQQALRITWLTLGNRTDDSIIIEALGRCFGANNGPKLVYRTSGGRWRRILDISGVALNVLHHRTNGLFDIERWQHSSAFDSVRFVYGFDGREYKPSSCKVVEFGDIATAEAYPKPKYRECDWNWKE